MPWLKRKSYFRTGILGNRIPVKGYWAFYQKERKAKLRSYRHPCPECGADIVTVPMKNGGWVHFEGGKGLGKVTHPCMHRGKGIPKSKDMETLDFEALWGDEEEET